MYSNGDTYVGEMLNNKKHGFGTMYYSNGNVYIGLVFYYYFIFFSGKMITKKVTAVKQVLTEINMLVM